MKHLNGIILGSSVAAEKGGWSYMLAESLQERGWNIVVAATPGYNTTKCKNNLEKEIEHALNGKKPDLVIVGLSLMNEGLIGDSNKAYSSFQAGMKDIIHNITTKYGAKVVLGGVYPCNKYNEEHHQFLHAMKKEMESWRVPLLDFLSVTNDGQGHWKEGIFYDDLHPNLEGHKLMFQNIDLKLFDQLREEITAQHSRL